MTFRDIYLYRIGKQLPLLITPIAQLHRVQVLPTKLAGKVLQSVVSVRPAVVTPPCEPADR